jgi:transposase InsO family protein
MMFLFVAQEKAHHPVTRLCRLLGVSPSGYYAWRCRGPSPRARRDAELTARIKQVYHTSRGVYGAPRVHAELTLGQGLVCGRKRVARLMRVAGLVGVHRRRYHGITRRDPRRPLFPDRVQRNFTPAAPDRLWVADLTQHRTAEGWLYAGVVLDAFSRRVVGWAMDERPVTELAVNGLTMAIQNRRPGPGTLHHSDHGAQYTALAFGRALKAARLEGSMGHVGDALDNAVAESFFATLQTELLDRRSWSTRQQLRSAIFEYIEGFYNRQRRHSTLGYLSPAEFERRWSSLHTSVMLGPIA